jgi:hypothetical protein
MPRHPSENFIKYLMTSGHQAAPGDDWVRMMVTSLNYPAPDPAYLSWLRNDLNSKIPADFRPLDRYHADSRKFLKSEGIFGFHQQSKEVKEANEIVLNYRIRSMAESLLLGRLEAKDVAKKINIRYGTYHTEEGIDAYRHYYWQIGIMRVEDWMVLLPNPTDDIQKQNIIAISQVGAAMALHKTGVQQQIDSKSMLRSMQESLYFDFVEWRTKKHGGERTKSLTSLAKAAVMVDEQLSQSDSALKDSLKAFEQFRMETEKVAVPDLRSIAPGGNFSDSGAKLIEAKTSDEDDAS